MVETVEQFGWSGQIRVVVTGVDGTRHTVEFPNLITAAGKQLMATALRDATAKPEITWVAVGSDGTAPAAADTELGDETFRKQVTVQEQGSNTNQTVTTVYLAPYEANGQIEEIGWFAGNASATADSGILIARVLYSKLKDNLESIQIERTDTFT